LRPFWRFALIKTSSAPPQPDRFMGKVQQKRAGRAKNAKFKAGKMVPEED
jgi:hypothetical protein